MSTKPRKVLHITTAQDNSVYTALENYLHASRHLAVEHYLLAKISNLSHFNKSHSFIEATFIQSDLLSFLRQIKQSITEIKPEFIHLHASFAGFIGRFLRSDNFKTIYTPHCYAFEKYDISPRVKALLMWFESLMLDKIDIIAGSSERECALAVELGAKKSIYLNHYAKVKASNNIAPANPPPFNIFIVGNLSTAKDPMFLLQTLKILKKYSSYKKLKFYWLGEGDNKFSALLKKHQVQVSPVLTLDKISKALQKAHLYIQTSAWDGMPLNLLQAAKLHIPTLIRFIPAIQGIPYPFVAFSPSSMAELILRFIQNPWDPEYYTSLNLFNSHFTEQKQRQILQKIYNI